MEEEVRCNQEVDCDDKSDEEGCGIITISLLLIQDRLYSFSFNQWSCLFNSFPDYQCVSNNETKCEKTGRCIDNDYLCDGQLDCCGEITEGSGEDETHECDDNTDEKDCSMFHNFHCYHL